MKYKPTPEDIDAAIAAHSARIKAEHAKLAEKKNEEERAWFEHENTPWPGE